MNVAGQPKPELLHTLIAELELAINWLSQGNPPPSEQEARERFLTLREAAAFTGASAIEGWLTELETKPFERQESSAYLTRLTQASRMLAEPHAGRELDWLGQNSNIVTKLEDLAKDLLASSERLGQFSMLVERCVTTLSERERAELSSRLTQKLFEEIRLQRVAHRRLLGSVEALRMWARDFSQEWDGVRQVLLSPRLAELHTWLQHEAGKHGQTVTWQLGDLMVERDQVEPLMTVLRELFGWIVANGSEKSPRPRPKSPPFYSKLNVSGEGRARLVTVSIELDGAARDPPLSLSAAANQALTALRGRLVSHSYENVYRLMLQFVTSGRCEDVVPVHSQAGLILLPIWIVKEIDLPLTAAIESWPRIALPTAPNQTGTPIEDTGVLVEIGSYKAFLPGKAAGKPFRAEVHPALATDSAWIQGRSPIQNKMHPVICPLPFLPIEQNGSQLYPNNHYQQNNGRQGAS
jgi:hypothetical protein